MATYKIYDHPFRSKMIYRLCVEIYEIHPDSIPKDIEQKLCFMTYQEIIKPLAHKDFKSKTTAGDLSIKYGVTERVMKSVLLIANI